MSGSSPAPAGRRWEHFAHPAGIGLRARGASAAAAFEEAAKGLFAALVDPSTVRRAAAVHVDCGGGNRAELLANFLGSLASQAAARRVVLSDITVRLENSHLSATAYGEALDEARHTLTTNPATLTITHAAFTLKDRTRCAECVLET